MPIPKKYLKCYWIVCYYPPVDWRGKIKMVQVNPAELSPEVQATLGQMGALPTLGEMKPMARR